LLLLQGCASWSILLWHRMLTGSTAENVGSPLYHQKGSFLIWKVGIIQCNKIDSVNNWAKSKSDASTRLGALASENSHKSLQSEGGRTGTWTQVWIRMGILLLLVEPCPCTTSSS
jgi:hypothetical protein